MKTSAFFLLSGCLMILTVISCKKTDNNETNVTDKDGNIYHPVTIGTQVWLKENLKTTKYRNGDNISTGLDTMSWRTTTSGAYLNYNDDVSNAATYGRLYNWYAVSDSRNICPEGWHIPSNSEWTTLINYLGGDTVAGNKMKSTTLWTSHAGINNTNSSGFTALPAGLREGSQYYDLGDFCYFWSSTQGGILTQAGYINLGYNDPGAYPANGNKANGQSVRCIKN